MKLTSLIASAASIAFVSASPVPAASDIPAHLSSFTLVAIQSESSLNLQTINYDCFGRLNVGQGATPDFYQSADGHGILFLANPNGDVTSFGDAGVLQLTSDPAKAAYPFSIDDNNILSYNGSETFYACPLGEDNLISVAGDCLDSSELGLKVVYNLA